MLLQTGLEILTQQGKGPRPSAADVRTVGDEDFLRQSRPALEALEGIRLEKLRQYELRKKIAIPVAAIAAPFCLFADYWLLFLWHTSGDRGAGITFLVMGAIFAWATHPRRQYTKAYKIDILPKIARLFGDFTYNVAGKINMGLMLPSKIVPGHNIYDSEDHFRGEYEGITMEFAEITLKQRTRSGKSTSTVTTFKGLAVLLDTKHKRFFGHTTIEQNSGKMMQWLKEKTGGMERADMVDPEFEKIFDAWTNDQVEARYLIDPLMIEKLKGLYAEYDGQKMAAAFYENKMLILVASKRNHFEPAGIYTPATDPVSILTMKKEVGEILSIIDKLSLYDPKAVQEKRMAAGATV